MRELRVSAKTVRRAELELDSRLARSGRRRRKVVLAGMSLALLGGLAGFVANAHLARRAAERERLAQAEHVQARRAEGGLYASLDARDTTRVDEAVTHLRSEDESLRLAAFRYLAKTDPTGHAASLVAALDDPADRVRRVAIQQVGTRVGGPLAEQALTRVALSSERSVPERTLALHALLARQESEPQYRAGDARELARTLLALLEDRQPAVRYQVGRVLEALVGARPAESGQDPKGVAAAWRRLLEESSG